VSAIRESRKKGKLKEEAATPTKRSKRIMERTQKAGGRWS
jgi:hypothetical protein